jgi:hypothetical protein
MSTEPPSLRFSKGKNRVFIELEIAEQNRRPMVASILDWQKLANPNCSCCSGSGRADGELTLEERIDHIIAGKDGIVSDMPRDWIRDFLLSQPEYYVLPAGTLVEHEPGVPPPEDCLSHEEVQALLRGRKGRWERWNIAEGTGQIAGK